MFQFALCWNSEGRMYQQFALCISVSNCSDHHCSINFGTALCSTILKSKDEYKELELRLILTSGLII